MADSFTPYSVVSKIADKAKQAFKGVAVIPSNVRALGKSIVAPEYGITENDFSEDELEALRKAYINSQERSNSPNTEEIRKRIDYLQNNYKPTEEIESFFTGDFVPVELELELLKRQLSPTIQYSDYPYSEETRKYDVGTTPLTQSFVDPGYATSMTLGRAKYEVDDEGNVILLDRYDFPKGGNMEDYKNWSLPFKAAHYVGEKFSKPMKVRVNLGKVKR